MKCIGQKLFDAKSTRLVCLLSFASLLTLSQAPAFIVVFYRPSSSSHCFRFGAMLTIYSMYRTEPGIRAILFHELPRTHKFLQDFSMFKLQTTLTKRTGVLCTPFLNILSCVFKSWPGTNPFENTFVEGSKLDLFCDAGEIRQVNGLRLESVSRHPALDQSPAC